MHRRREGSAVGGGHHDECGARAYNEGLGAESPARSRGRAPGQGVREQSPPEAESILVIGCPTEPANLAPVRENSMLCYGLLVLELGGGRVHGDPNPFIGGLCPPPAPPPMARTDVITFPLNTGNEMPGLVGSVHNGILQREGCDTRLCTLARVSWLQRSAN